MTRAACLADHGKHHWRYREDSMLGRLRECQKCGVVQQFQTHEQSRGRWVEIVGEGWKLSRGHT